MSRKADLEEFKRDSVYNVADGNLQRLLDDRFTTGIKSVIQAAVREFDFLGLPEGDGLEIELNEALTAIFDEYK